MKTTLLTFAMVVVAAVGFTGGSINTSGTGGWLSFSQAETSPYRRTARRNSYYY